MQMRQKLLKCYPNDWKLHLTNKIQGSQRRNRECSYQKQTNKQTNRIIAEKVDIKEKSDLCLFDVCLFICLFLLYVNWPPSQRNLLEMRGWRGWRGKLLDYCSESLDWEAPAEGLRNLLSTWTWDSKRRSFLERKLTDLKIHRSKAIKCLRALLPLCICDSLLQSSPSYWSYCQIINLF